MTLFDPYLAFSGESSSLQRWQFLLTENIRFCAFLPQYEGAVNENCTPCYVKSIFHGLQTFSRLIGFFAHYHTLIDDGTYANIKALAEAIGIDSGVVAKATRLTLLSPTIVHKLILGEADLSMQTLRRSFPLVWEKQERELLR